MISEVARAVLAELEAPLEKLRTDPTLVEKYQRLIFERQMEAEKKIGESFVSDRAFDNLAYAAEHTTIVADILESARFRDYMAWVSDGIVFFIGTILGAGVFGETVDHFSGTADFANIQLVEHLKRVFARLASIPHQRNPSADA